MEPKLLPLVEPIESRYQSVSVDSRLVNAIAEKSQGGGGVHVYRRPGYRLKRSLGAGTARGFFNWQGNQYAVVGGSLTKNGVVVGAVANSGFYSFTSCLGANPVLFLQNGTNAYTVTVADVLAAVVDPNYPASTVAGAVYLDATTYVMNATSGVFGSTAAGNDPATWDPLNLILAQIEPTPAVCLAKQLVYVLAMKTGYTEAFYDAGNPTGSPLAAVQGAKMNFGCVDARTVRDVGGDLVWVSDTGEGFYTVVAVSGLKLEVISTPAIERLLSAGTVGNFFSWNCRILGHRLYGVTNTAANITLVFDFTSRLWYQWTDANGNYLPYAYSAQGSGATVDFLHATNGKVFTIDLSRFIDEGDAAFPTVIYTPNFDGDTRRTKTLPRMDILGDKVASTLSVEFSDDDYATWTGGFTADMSLDRPSVEGLGSFTKRAFRLTHQANTAFRLKAAELYMDVAES